MEQVYGRLILWLLKGEWVGTELGAKTVRQEQTTGDHLHLMKEHAVGSKWESAKERAKLIISKYCI